MTHPGRQPWPHPTPGSQWLWPGLMVVAGLIVCCLPMQALATPQEQEKLEQLRQLRGRIETLQQRLDESIGQRDTQQQALRQVERKIGDLHRHLQRLDKELKSEQSKLKGLKLREDRARTDQRRQTKGLEAQVRAAYATGRQEYLKLLLSQQDPAEVSRVLVYYRYLNQARLSRIDEIETGLRELTRLQAQIEQRSRQLAVLQAERQQEKKLLDNTRVQRGELLASLNRQVLGQSQQIEQLRHNEQRLEVLIDNLRGYLSDVRGLPQLDTRFQDSEGTLPLPVKGRLTARFGNPKQQGDLKWKGVFISASPGSQVGAVFRGRVAYADWLRGYGLLLILEHGDGYMTLYGHNQSLYKEVGDWVEKGEMIATSGNTGNPPESGVYFEVRQDGKPYDPLRWCGGGHRANIGIIGEWQ